MDRLHGMKVFEKVADCGSFTAAAEACGMTPQNIAKIIAALEKDIGAQLLNRSTRRQNLTEIGEMYLERDRVILADVEESDALVSHFTGEVKGTLRVSVANTFAIYQLSHKLPGWLKENPGIRLDMTVTNREVNLIEEGFDVAVTDEEPPESSLIRHRISELPSFSRHPLPISKQTECPLPPKISRIIPCSSVRIRHPGPSRGLIGA